MPCASRRTVAKISLMVALSGLIARPAPAAILDPNWTESPWIATTSGITAMAWAPDGSGRLFLTRKTGEIRIVKMGPPPTLVATPFATVSPVYTSSECGVIGIAFDPNFLENQYVYVFVTVSNSQQQIIRYTAVGDIGMAKTTLIPSLPTNGANHDGGSVGFGPDGRLYWSIGDLGSGVGVDADLTSLASKVGRANPDATVPKDNPFVDGVGSNNDYIFARGFRNPYTATFQRTTGTLWVDVAGGNYEQIFAVGSSDHAGWNDYENNQPAGYITPKIKYRTNSVDIRNIVGAAGAVRSGNVATITTTAVHGFRQGEKLAVAGVTDISFNGQYYVASVPTPTSFTYALVGANTSSGGGTATTQNQGGAITGGTFYDSTGVPAAYQGNFFYGDYNSGRLMRAVVGPGTTVTSVDYFVTGNTNSIDVSVGPDGALYYVGFGGNILRATYNAASQGLVVSPQNAWMNEGGSAVFHVRLATAPAADVTVDVTFGSGSSDVAIASGTSLTFTPANFAVPQTVVLSATEDLDLVPDTATMLVSSSGLATETVQVQVADIAGVSGNPAPGRVPDGAAVPGTALTLAKDGLTPGNLDLDWGTSCGATATDYSVHEGRIGAWYSHNAILCSTTGATDATITPGSDSHYYLVVPLDAASEGSYGTDSAGTERARSTVTCRFLADVTPCP